jgi:hypothetical protein
MSLSHIRKPTFIVLFLLLALFVLNVAPQPAIPAPGDNAIALKAPSFVKVASAQEAPDAAPIGFPQDEAGISTYFKVEGPVDLSLARAAFRTLEVETADYLIGSVPVPNYLEVKDVHVYVHQDGWFLGYYLRQDATGKIFDWIRYYAGNRRTIPTTLETALGVVAGQAGVSVPGFTYYDFLYPNATHLMLIAEDTSNGNYFQVNLPVSFSFYERSWSLGAINDVDWWLNGTRISYLYASYQSSEGTLTGAQLPPNTIHTIAIGGNGFGGLALVYRVP